MVLCGVDLASTPDGRAYHSGAPRGAARVSVDPTTGLMRWDGDEQDVARAKRSGQRPQPREVGYGYTPSHDWGELLPALPTWQNQREWLTTEASRRLGEVECLNATEGGGGIVWWRHVRLSEVIEAEPEVERLTIPDGHVIDSRVAGALRGDLVRDAHVQRQVCEQILSPEGPDLEVLAHIPRVVEGSQILEAMAEHKILDAPSAGANRLRFVYECWRDMASEALVALGDEAPEEAA